MGHTPYKPGEKVGWLLLDLNSYFASVEQQINPKLRGKPVAVVPMIADSTCAIAASYEAKAFGVKTGTKVAEAKRLCPQLILVKARHELYVEFHNAIIEAIESCLPISAVLSIDEMACQLMGSEQIPENAIALSKKIKQSIKERVGTELRSSIGLAPNRYLAKVASDMQKPDGLTLLTQSQLPHALHRLKLQDLPGIGAQMQRRLHAFNIFSVRELLQKDMHTLREVWGGINGERFWYYVHGHNIAEVDSRRSSISQSSVLSPEDRSNPRAYAILQKLLHKAAYRLRKEGFWATHFQIKVKFIDGTRWKAESKLIECQDTLSLIQALEALWKPQQSLKWSKASKPIKVSLSLNSLVADHCHNLSLFSDESRAKLANAMDQLNAKLGKNAVYFGGIQEAKTSAPTCIAFTNIPDDFL